MLRMVLTVALIFTSCARQDESSSNVLELHPISELPQRPETQPTLIGGRAADPKDWPASMYAEMGGARCTATIVGEKVLLIAAHCVSNGGTARFKAMGQTYSAVCTHSREYRGNPTADYAACQIDRPVTDVAFEMVNQDPNLVKVGEQILLTGFGCVQPGGGGGNDGTYRIGESFVSRLPQGSDNDLITRGPAALCYGDSGGPAFKVVGSKRYQLSINSRGDIRQTSYLSYLATNEGKRFLSAWLEQTGLEICGVTEGAKGCRGGESSPSPSPTPPPSPSPNTCMDHYERLGKCLFSTGTLAVAPAVCYQAAGMMFSCLEEKYK